MPKESLWLRHFSDPQGFYRFEQLLPGHYRITESTPAGYLPGQAAVGFIAGQRVGNADSSGDVISNISLPAGSSGVNYDFGELLSGSISGRVIADINGNCIIDAAGERPLPGVSIELLNANGSVILRTQTTVDGSYRFDDLPPGVYSVREVQPAGFFDGGQHAGSAGGDPSRTNTIGAISLLPGLELTDYDFCEIPPSSIAGSVFVDSDQDLVFDRGESPIAGVMITLLDAAGNVVATTTTDASGNYVFQGIRAGRL